MKIFKLKQELQHYLNQVRAAGKTIGLVPTMGALHNGHLSLIEQARQQADVVVCSIFVNPTQFTDAKDLEKYPRPIAQDTAKLEQAGCDVLFNPEVTEMYAGNEHWHLDLGSLEHLLEGEFRPGHYQGVTQVVFKLFDVVKADVAFFGQKDYQQFMVINRMVEMLHLPIRLVMCPIVREDDGLAMSSRNIHLSPQERQHALALSKILFWLRNHFDPAKISELEQTAFEKLKQSEGVQAEYLKIVDGKTLQPAKQNSQTIVALIAARVGQTRLIDNVLLVYET